MAYYTSLYSISNNNACISILYYCTFFFSRRPIKVSRLCYAAPWLSQYVKLLMCAMTVSLKFVLSFAIHFISVHSKFILEQISLLISKLLPLWAFPVTVFYAWLWLCIYVSSDCVYVSCLLRLCILQLCSRRLCVLRLCIQQLCVLVVWVAVTAPGSVEEKLSIIGEKEEFVGVAEAAFVGEEEEVEIVVAYIPFNSKIDW